MIWRNFFRRKRPGAPPSVPVWLKLPDSTEDWQVGDVAVCQTSTWFSFGNQPACCPYPAKGERNRVAGVQLAMGAQFLKLDGYGDIWFLACEFLKLRPDERKAATPDFVKKMRRLRPLVSA